MEVLNAIAVILTIVSSGISIYLFVSERHHRGGGRSESAVTSNPTIDAGAPPHEHPTARSDSPEKPSRTGAVPAWQQGLHKAVSGFWALIGFACLSEGMTYGDGFLLLLSGLFFWLAYKLWPSSQALVT
jgi:hypothetical protein